MPCSHSSGSLSMNHVFFHFYSPTHLAKSEEDCYPHFAYMGKLRGSQEKKFT